MSTTTLDITLPRALLDANQRACDALDKRARLDKQVDTLPAEIDRHERDLGRLHDELARAEADVCIAEHAEQTQAQERADELRPTIEAAASELGNARRRLEALEGRAEEIDQAIVDAAGMFEIELQAYLRALTDGFDDELDRALAPARDVVARVLALRPLGHCTAFLNGMLVPHPSIDWRLDGIDPRLVGGNLLEPDAPDPTLVELLKPIIATRARLRSHRPYDSLAERRRRGVESHRGFVIESAPPATREFR